MLPPGYSNDSSRIASPYDDSRSLVVSFILWDPLVPGSSLMGPRLIADASLNSAVLCQSPEPLHPGFLFPVSCYDEAANIEIRVAETSKAEF